MFGRSAQAAGGHGVDAFVEEVSNHRYDAAEELLFELVRTRELDDEDAARCQDLLHQIQRLVRDQERLAEVAAGLAFDEQQTCAELRSIASAAAASPTAATPAPTTTATDEEHPDIPSASVEVDRHRLKIWLLGSCRLSCDGRSLDGGNGDQAAAVLRYIASQPSCGAHKDQLAALFWPDSDERSARRSLHQAVYNIRRRLQHIGADHELEFINDRYRLGTDDRWRDIDEFERAVADARIARDAEDDERLVAACERVDELYSGDFLADQPYDEWAENPRRHYRMLFRDSAGFLLDHWWKTDRFCHVVELADRLLQFDPVDEEAARRSMGAHHRLGHPQLAATVYAALTDALAQLGLTPAPETIALARRTTTRPAADE